MKIIVIGGGVSGTFAAIELKRRGHDVTILEKKDRILKKMLTTGNGRCNLTNTDISVEGYNSVFVENALEDFTNQNFIDYLKTLGIYTTTEGDRIYPKTLKAQTVVSQLLEELDELGIEVVNLASVLKIEKKDNFIVYTNEKEYFADRVVFSTGGCSMPNLGSDGKSFEILKKLGHHITNLYPALTQIVIESNNLKALSGVKVVSESKILVNGEVVAKDYGEVLFTEYGLSGPPILNLSKAVNLASGDCEIVFSLINHTDENTKDELLNMFYVLNHFSIRRFLAGVIDKKLISYVCKKLNLDEKMSIENLDYLEFEKLVDELINHKMKIKGTRGFEHSQVTLGGVDLDEVDNKTFESKIVKGLYIIGEALNIDGICGGYNIQWAVSSAMGMSKNI